MAFRDDNLHASFDGDAWRRISSNRHSAEIQLFNTGLYNTSVLLRLECAVFVSRSELRWEFATIAVALALLSVALCALALFFLRRHMHELTLVYFGLFAMLYSARLLGVQPSVRSLFDEPGVFWNYFDWTITCTLALPLYLFLLQVVSKPFKPFFQWLVTVQGGFSFFGVVAAAFGVALAKLSVLNSVMVLATLGTAAIYSAVWWPSRGPGTGLGREVRIFIAGFVVWLLFVVHANLLGLGVLKGHNVEFLGFMAFVAALGYISAHRVFANEQRLLTINKELEIACQIQSSILPQGVPMVRGLEIAARYAPMSAVAGDFYDFLDVDEKRVGVLIADVTGHGVPAALIASMLKVAFAGQVGNAQDPARVLMGLNHALCGKFEEHFVTAAYVYVDLELKVLRYAGAGHPPLLRRSSTGRVEELEQNGLMLGLFPEATYTSLEIAVSPGDRFLLYTDGVSEAKSAAQEEFGKARLLKFLEGHKDSATNRLSDDLLAEITSWSRDSQNLAECVQDDDITLMLLDVCASP